MARRFNTPFADIRPATMGLFLLTTVWALFQWRDPTPPPVLDQILVASFGVWFANEAIDKKNDNARKKNQDDDEDAGQA